MGRFVLTGKEAIRRGKELELIRKRAYQHFFANPLLTSGELRYILLSEGDDIKNSTCTSWISRWRKKPKSKDVATIPTTKVPISFEQLIALAPNIETIGALLLEGFIARLKEKDNLNEALKEEIRQLKVDMNKLQSEFNERLAKVKVGTLTLDTLQHKLLRKE